MKVMMYALPAGGVVVVVVVLVEFASSDILLLSRELRHIRQSPRSRAHKGERIIVSSDTIALLLLLFKMIFVLIWDGGERKREEMRYWERLGDLKMEGVEKVAKIGKLRV